MRIGRVVGAALLVVACVAPTSSAAANGRTRCRPTPPREVIPGFMPVVGAGPVYGAVLLNRNPVVLGYDGSSWGGAKVLWIGEPSYDGKVVIEGRRVDAPGTVRFGSARPFQARLKLSSDEYAHGSWAGSAAGWRDWPSTLRMRTRGCYELRVTTSDGIDRIVFRAARQGVY